MKRYLPYLLASCYDPFTIQSIYLLPVIIPAIGIATVGIPTVGILALIINSRNDKRYRFVCFFFGELFSFGMNKCALSS